MADPELETVNTNEEDHRYCLFLFFAILLLIELQLGDGGPGLPLPPRLPAPGHAGTPAAQIQRQVSISLYVLSSWVLGS